MRSLREVEGLRQPNRRANCSFRNIDAHLWDPFGAQVWTQPTDGSPGHFVDMTIVVLCTNCGRTPNEVLDDMPVSAGGQVVI